MGNVEIKFYGKLSGKYHDTEKHILTVDCSGNVWIHSFGCSYITPNIEPHFYLNGERIA